MSTNPPGDKVPISDLNNVLMTGKALDKTITQELEFPDLADLLVCKKTTKRVFYFDANYKHENKKQLQGHRILIQHLLVV